MHEICFIVDRWHLTFLHLAFSKMFGYTVQFAKTEWAQTPFYIIFCTAINLSLMCVFIVFGDLICLSANLAISLISRSLRSTPFKRCRSSISFFNVVRMICSTFSNLTEWSSEILAASALDIASISPAWKNQKY